VYLHSGQMCEAGTRCFVPAALYDDVVARMVEMSEALKVGSALDFETDIGPLVDHRQVDTVKRYVHIGLDEGAKLLTGGEVPQGVPAGGYYFQPTIFGGVQNNMKIAQEEIFGPVLSVIRYSDEEEAVQIANDTEYGLSAGVWSGDYERALEVAGKIRAGTVWVNDMHMVSAAHPFGGYKQSGLGRELGPSALDEYTEAKHVHVDLTQKLESRMYDLLLSEPPA
jgi:aldehyde dehydrogenase (NAD+)